MACKYTLIDGIMTIKDGVKIFEDSDISFHYDIVEVIAPGSLKKIKDSAYWGAFWNCDRIEKVTFQPGLEEIGARAFNGCKSLKEIQIPDTVKKIGQDAFKRCDSLAYIVVPGMHLSELQYKPMAALGYCVQPERFADPAIRAEYETYIRKHMKTVLNRAKQFECNQAIQYLKDQGLYSEDSLKLTPKEIVLEIEHAILDRDYEHVKRLTEKYPEPELTARALGFACRVADPRFVQLLLDCGYSFEYDAQNEKLVAAYSLKVRVSNDGPYHWADFAILPFYENIWDKRVFGKLENHYVKGSWNGMDGMMDTFGIPEKFAMAEEQIRVENIELLCRNGKLSRENLNLALYYSVLHGDNQIMELLQSYGAVLDIPWLYARSVKVHRTRAARLFTAISKEKPEMQYEIFSHLVKLAIRPVLITDNMVNLPGITDSTLELMLSQGDIASVNFPALLREEIAQNHRERIEIILRYAELHQASLQQLIDLAAAGNKKKITALLLDYSNKDSQTGRSE